MDLVSAILEDVARQREVLPIVLCASKETRSHDPDAVSCSKWQVQNGVHQLLGPSRLCNQLEVMYALADRDLELMRVDDSSEGQAGLLASAGLQEEILILREQCPPERRSAIEELGVRRAGASVLLRSENVDPTLAQT